MLDAGKLETWSFENICVRVNFFFFANAWSDFGLGTWKYWKTKHCDDLRIWKYWKTNHCDGFNCTFSHFLNCGCMKTLDMAIWIFDFFD